MRHHRFNIQQSRQGEEGLVCLAICASILGEQHELRALRARAPLSQRGIHIGTLAELATSLGFAARVVRCDVVEDGNLVRPTIVQWARTGFVVFEGNASSGRKRIVDPIFGERTISSREFAQNLGRFGLEVLSCPPVTAGPQKAKLRPASLIRWSRPLWSAFAQCIVVSLFLQLYVIISPLFMRIVVDDIVVNGDNDLLNATALGFGLLVIFNAGASALRGVAVRHLSVHLGWDMTRRVFHHMLRLPLPWFEARRLGDVLGRLQGLDQVRNVITGGIGVLLDGAFSLATLTMLAVLSPTLAMVAGIGFALYVVLRVLGLPVIMRLTRRSVIAAAAEQGKRIETLSAIHTVKVMAAEIPRENDWAGTLAESLDTAQDAALASNYFSSVQSLVSLLTGVVAIYVGARAIINSNMTVGLLTAALAYMTQFSQRGSSLFEQVISWKMLDVQMGRLDDVLLEDKESGLDKPVFGTENIRGAIHVEGLSFRYGPQDPLLFKDLFLDIREGEHVAIVGPSGCGKSTLLKLLIGLYKPDSGAISLDGRPLSDWGPQGVRRALGVVMQDDRLLVGSIAENVSFFDDDVDIDEVWRCLAMAGIDDEVKSLPLLTDSHIGGMGSTLSGGQRQRLMIARALYRRPRVLILDEATSHLDVARERSIVETLRGLNITRIVVAHRPDTIAAADRVLRLSNGRLEAVNRELGPAVGPGRPTPVL